VERRRAAAHVGQEVFVRLPPLTNCDAARTIIGAAFVAAAFVHRNPCSILGRVLDGLAVLSISSTCFIVGNRVFYILFANIRAKAST
jgi:hypothetical protein